MPRCSFALSLCFAMCLSCSGASRLAAQDYIDVTGLISDDAFYRLVSCGAPPGEACQKKIVRWAKPTVTVGITKMDPGFLGGRKKRADAALVRAIQNINDAKAGIRLVRNDVDPDIPIFFFDMPAGAAVFGTGIDLIEGTRVSAASVKILSRNGAIFKSIVIFTMGLHRRSYESVMLDEITQGLGLHTDIGGEAYETRSVFSQTSNSVKQLGAQDRMALRRHYP